MCGQHSNAPITADGSIALQALLVSQSIYTLNTSIRDRQDESPSDRYVAGASMEFVGHPPPSRNSDAGNLFFTTTETVRSKYDLPIAITPERGKRG